MKYIFSEFKSDYENYNFPYQVLLKIDEKDTFSDIFELGFLPTRYSKNLFYLCRSLRIDLSKFYKSSENKRILNKTASFSYELVDLKDFEYSFEIQKLCKDWFNNRFEKKIISAEGVKKVFQAENNNLLFIWKKGDEIVGYVPCISTSDLLYYNFAFYNPSYYKENLGARMMLQAVLYAKELNKKNIYLGSVYTQSSLYKTEFKGFEFFNGLRWSSNYEELKYLLEIESSNDYKLRDDNYRQKYLEIDKISSL